jgi:hypothetical protein
VFSETVACGGYKLVSFKKPVCKVNYQQGTDIVH